MEPLAGSRVNVYVLPHELARSGRASTRVWREGFGMETKRDPGRVGVEASRSCRKWDEFDCQEDSVILEDVSNME
jgi:hypothetical protein